MKPSVYALYLNIAIQKHSTYRKIRRLEFLLLNMPLCRLHDHSVSTVSNNKTTMKSFALFCLFLVLTARKCFAGIIIQTNKLDEDFIRKAAVSSSVSGFFSYITHIFSSGKFISIFVGHKLT